MGEHLKGKNAIVTGAGRGVFKYVALGLAAEGANVLVVDPGGARDGAGTDAAPAEEVVQEIKSNGGEATACLESVTDFNTAQGIVQTCVDTYGRLDILVNGAGILREKMVYNMSEDDWDAVLLVHLKGTFNMCRHAAVLMREQKYGRIINTTSDAWRTGSVGQANYAAAKGAIVSFTRGLANELGRYGVFANVTAPLAATRLTLDERVIAGMKKRLEKGIITQEDYEMFLDMPGPEFVAPLVVYLATDEAKVNGEVFGVGGGRIARYTTPKEEVGIYKDYKKDGAWLLEDIIKLAPTTILSGL